MQEKIFGNTAKASHLLLYYLPIYHHSCLEAPSFAASHDSCRFQHVGPMSTQLYGPRKKDFRKH